MDITGIDDIVPGLDRSPGNHNRVVARITAESTATIDVSPDRTAGDFNRISGGRTFRIQNETAGNMPLDFDVT